MYYFYQEGCLARNDEVLVFGSNTAGRHGKGAAWWASTYRGYPRWRSEGFNSSPKGMAYAIPTKVYHKDRTLTVRDLMDIEKSVEDFKQFASEHPHLTFFVSRVGCGLSAIPDETMAGMFRDSTPNCIFSHIWKPFLKD